MCILIVKEKENQLPSKKRLEICFENNSDGCGFAYVKDGKVITEKGFMKFDSFYKRLMEVDKELDLYNQNIILHFRISTSGSICTELTHPYTITDNYNDMKKLYNESDMVMAHNGILPSKYIPSKEIQKLNINDTMTFINQVVYPLYQLDKYSVFKKFYQDMLEKEIGTNKIAFLNSNGEMTKIGNFILGDDGVYYSNDTYQQMWWSSYSTSSTVSGSYYYGNYYDYYEEDLSINEWLNTELDFECFNEILDSCVDILGLGTLILYEDNYTKTVEELDIDEGKYDGIFGILDKEILVYIDYATMQFMEIGKVLDILYEVTSK